MASKTTILKNAMNQPYCGQTRFNYLDGEEVVSILHAMDEYSEQENDIIRKESIRRGTEIVALEKENKELKEQRDELLKFIKKVNVSLRNGGHAEQTEFGRLYAESEKLILGKQD